MAEEDIVYPLLRDDADRAEASEKLYREHASMKSIYSAIALRPGPAGLDHQSAGAPRGDRAHAREEEDVEFPRLRNVLNQKQTASLSRKIHQEEARLVV